MIHEGQRVMIINPESPSYGKIGVVLRVSEGHAYIQMSNGRFITKRLENIKLVSRRMPVSPIFLQEVYDETTA